MEEKNILDQKKKTGFWPSQPAEKPASSQSGVGDEKWIEFKLNAPQAQNVRLVGTFNRWDTTTVRYRLTTDSQGVWRGSFPFKPGRYEYRFFVDGKWADDPNAKKIVPNEFGAKNAILEVR